MANWLGLRESLSSLLRSSVVENGEQGEHPHCLQCRYDLFGLPPQGKCPECALPVLYSLLLTVPAVPDDVAEPGRHWTRKRYEFIRDALGYPVDAFLFVRDAMRYVDAEDKGSVPPDRCTVPDVNAATYCKRVRAFALAYFGDAKEAVSVFREWNVLRSEDVGRNVFHLVDAGLLRASADDTPDLFAGLFTLDNWFRSET